MACSALSSAWEQSWSELLEVKYRWQMVKGPLAATAVLMDLGWDASKLDRWPDDLGAPWQIDFGREFTCLEVGLLASLRRGQNQIVSHQFFGEGLESGLDVFLHKKWFTDSPVKDAAMLQIWWQGALQHSLNSQKRTCSHCNVKQTLHHMLYECAACIEHCGPVPEAWIGLCCRPESLHFWLRGLVPRAWTTAEPITSEEVVRARYFLDPAAFEGQAARSFLCH